MASQNSRGSHASQYASIEMNGLLSISHPYTLQTVTKLMTTTAMHFCHSSSIFDTLSCSELSDYIPRVP